MLALRRRIYSFTVRTVRENERAAKFRTSRLAVAPIMAIENVTTELSIKKQQASIDAVGYGFSDTKKTERYRPNKP